MALEQTINKSQKSSSGIIGSTNKKLFVAEWELIYHEMLAVSNVHRELSGVKSTNNELTLHPEFTSSKAYSTECKIRDIITVIKSQENPFSSPCAQPVLHNIMNQQIMTEDIRSDLLNVREKANAIYADFRHERFIIKSHNIAATIHRHKLKTFNSIHANKKSATSRKCDVNKECAIALKTMDLARVREYDMKELLKYDLIPTSYLFDSEQLMTKPAKSTLLLEVEKHLSSENYIDPNNWVHCKSAYLVDVMASVRKICNKRIRTFGELCDNVINYIGKIAATASRIDFVFDTYMENSVKDSERSRRCHSQPIELLIFHFWSPAVERLVHQR